MCLTHQDAQSLFFFFLNSWMYLKTMQRMSAWYPSKLESVSFPPYQWNYMFFLIARFFFLDLLASPICNCSHWPSSLSSSSVYLTFPSLLKTTSTKRGFPSKKIPTKKKSTLLQWRSEIATGGHVNKVKRIWGLQASGPPRRREKLDCPRHPLLPFLRRDVSGRGPSTPTQQAIIFQESHLDMWLLSSHLRSSPATVSWDVYGVGMISEDGSAWMISCLDLAGTFFHLF